MPGTKKIKKIKVTEEDLEGEFEVDIKKVVENALFEQNEHMQTLLKKLMELEVMVTYLGYSGIDDILRKAHAARRGIQSRS